MGAMSASHWLIVGVVIILLFGSRKLGSLGAGLGEGIRNFKKGIKGDDDTVAAAAPIPKQLKDPVKTGDLET